MSNGSPGSSWQQDELVASFADRRAILVPLLDLQEDVIRRLLARRGHPIERVLDLGCGDGAMTELVLAAAAAAGSRPHAVLVDLSHPMLERAQSRLQDQEVDWRAVAADLNEPAWRGELPDGRYDVAISGLALHHLPRARKRELFAEVFELLEPDGIFLNMDYVAIDGPLQGLFDEQMRANALRAARESGDSRPADEVDLQDDDDRPDTVLDQLQWLRDAGFAQVEVHFKWAEAAVFGGVRKEGPCSQ
jgi:tRNA (cmo5U34)-methyltransferase